MTTASLIDVLLRSGTAGREGGCICQRSPGLSVSLSSALGYFILVPAAILVLAAALLSFIPKWSPSDLPYSPGR